MFKIIITDLDKNETMVDVETKAFCNLALQDMRDEGPTGVLMSSAARGVSSFDLLHMLLGLRGANKHYLEERPELAIMLMLGDDLIDGVEEIDLTGLTKLKNLMNREEKDGDRE